MKVEYSSGIMSIYFEEMVTPVLEVSVNLEDVLGSDSAWVGFTGSGGAAYQIENVLSWSFTTGGDSDGSLFRRGDCNDDGGVDITDAVFALNFLFTGGPPPHCEDSADSDDSGGVEITDSVYLLNHLFLGGPDPQQPFSECGSDPTADELKCDSFDACLAF